MGRIIDLTGQRFERWTVIGFAHQTGSVVYWSCVCDCGVKRAVFGGDLKRGGSKSCGCLTRELAVLRMTTHGLARHPAYSSWQHIKTRCEDDPLYRDRGITVCPEWLTFDGFWKDMGRKWRDGSTIDRIDNDKGYEPGNCRWATPKQQANNRRTNRIIQTPRGPMNVTEAAAAFGINRSTLFARIHYGWPEDRLLEPV